ncbi:redoxin family protein [Paludisphaera rhizosphaerae]|uniref:redoxin family protein n=1 Tax=Paludisphaera rhizosphaerae TaxID=2711216 RepID=UPI0013EA6E88|nr:redoxin family protein [Paludisphaera rhizosphaerae]
MRFRPGTLGLLVVGAGLAGCTQTGGLRAVTPSDVKTTASVGDKPLPSVAGLPDDERRSAGGLPESSQSSGARISGRVYDDQGEPVRNAVVRLAMTGAAGGRAVHATTDRSGGFTLRGVRPGSNYTVIAEYQGEQGIMTGRADAEAPDTSVRISLHPRDAAVGSETKDAVAASDRSRVKAVARAEEPDETNPDDLLEPEAPRRSSTRPAPVKPRLEVTEDADEEVEEAGPGWSQRGTAPKTRASARPVEEEPVEYEEEGENPLPPAREISRVSARMEDPFPAEEDEPGALPDGLVNQSNHERPDDPKPGRKGPRAAAPPVERARPTWADVISESGRVPVDANLAQTSTAVATTATVAAKTVAVKPTPDPKAKAAAPSRSTPYCDYDADEQKMIDFAKFDVDGKLVSIRDFDADLILLDFWGSWCGPCRTSIPHLKEIQSRLGGKKLQVVSVAFEQIKPEKRAARLKELRQELGINYPILVAGFQDDDVVRNTLQVWFFPTMILIDREGRIVHREQGATAVTLAKMDRAITEYMERGSKPQYAQREPKGRASR